MKRADSFRFNLPELGGALGDLGTLLPITVALITLNHMNATSVFLVVGLVYVITGFFYRLPVPVQPLKAVAAIAIAGGLSATIISASGLLMGVLLLILAGTGLINLIARLYPRAVIRGIQLGVGLLLVKTGLLLVSKRQVIISGGDSSISLANLSISAGWLIAIALGMVFILLLRNRKLPGSLVLLALGLPIGMFWGSWLELPGLRFGLSLPALTIPSLTELSTALVLLVIPQIPLTLGNAVFAMSDTAKTYFGAQASRVTPKALLTTMGLATLGAGLLGGMPVCHGSGGLTAHYRLGARTGAVGLLLGIPFLAMAVLLDGNVVPIFALVPNAVLGVLVIFVGTQHSLLVRDLKDIKEIIVALAVAIPGVLTANLAIGLASGIGLYLALALVRRRHSLRLGLKDKPAPLSPENPAIALETPRLDVP